MFNQLHVAARPGGHYGYTHGHRLDDRHAAGFADGRKSYDVHRAEETRHIVFFVNWMAWQQAQRGRLVVWLRHLISLHYYGRAIGRLIGTVRRGQKENDGKDFSATQASIFLEGFTIRRLIEACCAENRRRMAQFPAELLRPMLLPALAGGVLSLWRLVPGRKPA